MSRRDGYGTVQLRGFDVDHIPSAPFNPHAMTQSDPRHLVLPDDTAARRRPVESRFDPETGILTIDLWFHNPADDDVKQAINRAAGQARPGLKKVVLIMAHEVYQSLEGFHFCRHNGFERRGDEPAGYIRVEKPAKQVK